MNLPPYVVMMNNLYYGNGYCTGFATIHSYGRVLRYVMGGSITRTITRKVGTTVLGKLVSALTDSAAPGYYTFT